MSKPQPGTYIIYNMAPSPSGRLAITFNGQGNNATVTPLSNGDEQKWVVADYGDGTTQSVSPVLDTGLQAAWGNNVVTVLPAGAYVWTIRDTDAGYTIKDGGVTVNWGVNEPVIDEEVSIGSDTGSENQRWIFARV